MQAPGTSSSSCRGEPSPRRAACASAAKSYGVVLILFGRDEERRNAKPRGRGRAFRRPAIVAGADTAATPSSGGLMFAAPTTAAIPPSDAPMTDDLARAEAANHLDRRRDVRPEPAVRRASLREAVPAEVEREHEQPLRRPDSGRTAPIRRGRRWTCARGRPPAWRRDGPAEAMADEADAVCRPEPELVALDACVAASRRRRRRERPGRAVSTRATSAFSASSAIIELSDMTCQARILSRR